jgi:predicted enzyme related to lactoylglutathione lyase
MLKEANVYPTIPAADLDRAMGWYEEKLGLTPTEIVPAAAIYDLLDGSRFIIYPTPNPGRGGHTQMGFRVADLPAEVALLRSRGVVFEDYDFPGFKTVDGVAEFPDRRSAFFKDSEGNTIGLVQFL